MDEKKESIGLSPCDEGNGLVGLETPLGFFDLATWPALILLILGMGNSSDLEWPPMPS